MRRRSPARSVGRSPRRYVEPKPLDLNTIVLQTMTDISHSSFVPDLVEAEIKSTMKSVVERIFRSYGDFGKRLEETVQQGLAIDLDKLNIQQYNHMVMNALNGMLQDIMTQDGIKKMEEAVRELLVSDPKEYTLQDILNEIREEAREERNHSWDDNLSLYIEQPYGLIHVYIGIEDGQEKYQCKYRLTIDDKTGKMFRATIEGKNFDNSVIMGGLYGVEALIFKIYTSGSTIKLDYMDPDDYDLRISADED